MKRTQRAGVALAVLSALVLLVAVGGMAPALAAAPDSAGQASAGQPADDRPDDPSTADTVGYVEGYWYDDDLPVDDREDAALEDDELEAVVRRSMARVETIRDRPFEDEVPVEVISRETFEEQDDVFADLSEEERLQANVNYEALFMVDRETDAADEMEALYGGAVDGYYQPTTGQIVIVSDTPETPEMDEVILGHELLHALQDQHFDLTSYDRETIDQDNAKNGLVEGAAVWLDTEYADRCEDEWDCVLPGGEPAQPSALNWGMYLTIYQPYSDGPDYVEHLLEDGGWAAVDEAHDDPPASSSEVIRPGEDREPAAIEVEDRSSDDWEPFEVDGEVATETVGEAGMVAMFGGGALDGTRPSVIGPDALLEAGTDGFDYDQPYTDGWAGDQLVTYVGEEAADADEPTDAADNAGYVWETEWTSADDSRQFVDGYLELLDIHDAEAVDDRRDTYEIDDGYPGAYYLDRDGDTVTIVRAPSVDALEEIDAGAAPVGEDTLGGLDGGDDTTDEASADDGDAAGDDGDADTIPGFGVPGAVAAVAFVLLGSRIRSGLARR